MSVEYQRDDDRRLIRVRVHGEFRAEQVLELLTRMREDGTWSYALLYDVRLATGRPDLQSLRSIVDAASAQAPTGARRGRLAIVVVDAVLYGMMCAYAALATPGRVEVFRDIRDAEAWVAAPPPPPEGGGTELR